MKGIQVEDELRKCLLDEESENFHIFDESERDEFIFNLFRTIVIGGPLCQERNSKWKYY